MCTGNHASSVRTISNASVQFFVTRDSYLIDVKGEGSNACESKPLESMGMLVPGIAKFRPDNSKSLRTLSKVVSQGQTDHYFPEIENGFYVDIYVVTAVFGVLALGLGVADVRRSNKSQASYENE